MEISQELKSETYRPLEALNRLSPDSADPGFEKLKLKLLPLPEFERISESDLYKLCSLFENVVNITGYSGQGIHPAQLKLLKHAFPAVMADMGWKNSDTLIMSGGTAIGIPDAAIEALAKHDYKAVGVMALPGVAYPITPGYSFICAEDSWLSWGSETEAMAKGANATFLLGGGDQALKDALIAITENEEFAMLVNCFNGKAKIPCRVHDEKKDLIVDGSKLEPDNDGILKISELYEAARKQFVAEGGDPEAAEDLKLDGLPVSGLVSELKKGQRRACGQDLVYFLITGERELLPEPFRERAAEIHKNLSSGKAGLYYLLDDPSEGIFGSSVVKINDALMLQNQPVINRIIENAVIHDVQSSDGYYGPNVLGARSADELKDILQKAFEAKFPLAA